MKKNFKYRNRGTIYSIPAPLLASARGPDRGSGKQNLILREDQKEWQRGVRKAGIRQSKEDRALRKAVKDPNRQGGLVDPDWMPPMMIDARSRASLSERIGTDGLPIIGHGRMVSGVLRMVYLQFS